MKLTELSASSPTASRTFTNAEVIRAIEQADRVWHDHVGTVTTHFRNSRSQLSATPRTDQIEKAIRDLDNILNTIDEIENWMDDTESRLKFGGRMKCI